MIITATIYTEDDEALDIEGEYSPPEPNRRMHGRMEDAVQGCPDYVGEVWRTDGRELSKDEQRRAEEAILQAGRDYEG